ncbi:acyltransferase family protein [Paraburkholderia sp. 22098]|uniref:acyltransferase family protein n=1 Tax=Paraburkholderia sp. 22098 TaxID=3453874 RepID=UPI003F83D7CA
MLAKAIPVRNNFNQIRFWLATAVVGSHCYPLLGYEEPNSWGMSVGGAAVMWFFVISGYLITQSWMRTPSIPSFMANRALRIAPAWIVSAVISYWLSARFNGYDANKIHTVNGTWWTLPWELACYAAVMGLGFIGALNRASYAAILGAIWVVYFAHWHSGSPTLTVVGTFFLVFAMGGFIAINEKHLQLDRTALWCAICIAPFIFEPLRTWLFAGIDLIPFYWGFGVPDVQIRQVALMITVPFIVICLAKCAKPLPFWRADLSYGIYVYGWPVQQSVIYWTRKHGMPIVHPYGVFLITMAILIPLSALSWYLLEKPALSLKRFIRHPQTDGSNRAH